MKVLVAAVVIAWLAALGLLLWYYGTLVGALRAVS